MGRPAKSPKVNAKAKLPVGGNAPKTKASVRDLEKRLAESLKREAESLEREKAKDRALTEALEQQLATGEILLSRSRTSGCSRSWRHGTPT
jgi:hypothetical protein